MHWLRAPNVVMVRWFYKANQRQGSFSLLPIVSFRSTAPLRGNKHYPVIKCIGIETFSNEKARTCGLLVYILETLFIQSSFMKRPYWLGELAFFHVAQALFHVVHSCVYHVQIVHKLGFWKHRPSWRTKIRLIVMR